MTSSRTPRASQRFSLVNCSPHLLHCLCGKACSVVSTQLSAGLSTGFVDRVPMLRKGLACRRIPRAVSKTGASSAHSRAHAESVRQVNKFSWSFFRQPGAAPVVAACPPSAHITVRRLVHRACGQRIGPGEKIDKQPESVAAKGVEHLINSLAPVLAHRNCGAPRRCCVATRLQVRRFRRAGACARLRLRFVCAMPAAHAR